MKKSIRTIALIIALMLLFQGVLASVGAFSTYRALADEVKDEAEHESDDSEKTESGEDIKSDADKNTDSDNKSDSDKKSGEDSKSDDNKSGEDSRKANDENSEEKKEEELKEKVSELKENLEESIENETVQAVVYLKDEYAIKKEPREDADTVVRIPTGSTVEIIDVDMNKEENVFYYVRVLYENRTYRGYIDNTYLAYSNESLIGFEEENLEQDQYTSASDLESTKGKKKIYEDIEQFPESYKSALYELKEKHPEWIFVKYDTNLDWERSVKQENTGDKSLVYYTYGDAYKAKKHSTNWYYATDAAVAYYMDPRNFLDETNIFMFEQLTYNSSYHTTNAIQSILSSTFMKGDMGDEGMSYAKAFRDIGEEVLVSPFHLAARVYSEQGTNGSQMIFGTYAGFEGYYNFFNVGAYAGSTEKETIINGLTYAKNQGWNTRYKSLLGGAKTIGNNYIKKGQDTPYLQKYNVTSTSTYSHQYMQAIYAPVNDAKSAVKAYRNAGTIDSTFVFKIPVYNNMPSSPAPKPGTTSTPNEKDNEAAATPAPTAKPTEAPKPTATPAPTSKPTEAPKPTATPAPTAKPTEAPKPTATPTMGPIIELPTATPRPTATPVPTTKPTEAPKPTATPTMGPIIELPTATPKPTAAPKPTATPAPTAKPTEAPKPTATPTMGPIIELPTATSKPTEAPKPTSTPAPTAKPTEVPKSPETPKPTEEPTSKPAATAEPTMGPIIELPTPAPTMAPLPSAEPIPEVVVSKAPVEVHSATPKPLTEVSKEDITKLKLKKDSTTLFGETIREIKNSGKNAKIELENGITWDIDANSIDTEKLQDINLQVSVNGDSKIPEDKLENINDQVEEGDTIVILSLEHDGEFGFDAILTIPMVDGKAGQMANLYFYNDKTGKLEFMCSSKISTSKEASFEFKHASDYVIIISDISKEKLFDNVENVKDSSIEEIVSTSDNSTVIEDNDTSDYNTKIYIICIVILGIIAVVIGAVLILKRREE
ncbi:MAG: hypothetical protein MJZ11_02465 [Lachnospiraceae bacterium]|nr:hypothetical protein [Lachnospiraceae bacterium]